MSRARVFNGYFNVESEDHATNKIGKLFEQNPQIKWYRGQLEQTDNGQLHLQMVWGYANPRSLAMVQKYMGPTIQITKDSDAMVQYCTDERKRVNDMEFSHGSFQLQAKSDNLDALIQKATEAGDYESAIKTIEEGNRRYYISQQKQLQAYFKQLFGVKDEVMYTIDQFKQPAIDPKLLATKTIVLHGGAAYGKTSYAMAHFKHPAVIKSKLDYVKITKETDGIIFDDMNLANWSVAAVKNLTDLSIDTYQDIKYSSVLLRKNLPRFICINNEASFWPKEIFSNELQSVKFENRADVEAISRRTHFVKVEEPLFSRKRKQMDIVRNEGSDIVTQMLKGYVQ